MSTLTAERLYSLLPAVYRLRDAEQGEPLRALLAAFAEQFAALEENVEQLYDDQFIETCADWVAPYIGDLIGYRPLHGVAPKIASPRAEVANTIAYRRRKGTALMLEQLAQRRHRLARARGRVLRAARHHAVHEAHPLARRGHGRSARSAGRFSASAAPSTALRTPPRCAGRRAAPAATTFPTSASSCGDCGRISLTTLPLVPDPGDAIGRKFRVNPLGADLRLFRNAQPEDDISHLAEPVNVPEPLSVRLMALAVKAAQASTLVAPDAVLGDDYGGGRGHACCCVRAVRPSRYRSARCGSAICAICSTDRRQCHRLEP